MAFVAQIGSGVIGGLEYLGSLADLGGKAAYYTFVAPFQGKPVRVQRAISQALDVGVRAAADRDRQAGLPELIAEGHDSPSPLEGEGVAAQ